MLDGLCKRYGELTAVDGLSLSVRRGEVFGLLGPNGAGKTTTIRMLVGLTEPSGGTASLNGLDVVRDRVKVKAGLGVVPELSNLYPELTCVDNLRYVAELYGVPARGCLARCEEVLQQVGLTEKREARFESLSRGMKRRLTIAAAVVHRPAVLFLDEPTTGLDVFSARGLRQLVRGLRTEGTTIVLTTHLISEADELCDRIGLLVKGKLIALDTPAALKARVAQEPALSLLLASPPSTTALDSLRGMPAITGVDAEGVSVRLQVTSVQQGLTDVVAWSASNAATVEGVSSQASSLEDAFVRLTGVEADVMRVDKPQKPGGGA